MYPKYKIQSVLIKKKYFSFNEACRWILENNFKIGRVDITKSLYRFRQLPVNKTAKYRIKTISKKIQFVIMF